MGWRLIEYTGPGGRSQHNRVSGKGGLSCLWKRGIELGYNGATLEEGRMGDEMVKIELTMYGIAEILRWCIDKNNGRIAGVDTAGFKKMQTLLAEKPQSADYHSLDQFWKKTVVLDFTKEEVETIDRCLYDIPNFENVQLPQIRHKFWPKEQATP